MGDYDAFGRKTDEAGLGDLGWGTTDDPAEPSGPHRTVDTTASDGGLSTPVEFTSATEFTSVPTGPPPVRRRGRSPIVWLIQLAVLGGIAFAIYLAVDAGKDAADKVRGAIEDFNVGTGPGSGSGADRGDDTVPAQVEARKLFKAAGLRDALRVMEREVPGKIANFSLRRDYISAQIVRNGERRIVLFPAEAEVPDVQATVAGGTVTDTFTYEEINPTAPEQLMRSANARTNRSEADVEYFVVSKFSGQVQWGIYYEGGTVYAQGDSRGRYLRKSP